MWQSQNVTKQFPSPLCDDNRNWFCSCDIIQLFIWYLVWPLALDPNNLSQLFSVKAVEFSLIIFWYTPGTTVVQQYTLQLAICILNFLPRLGLGSCLVVHDRWQWWAWIPTNSIMILVSKPPDTRIIWDLVWIPYCPTYCQVVDRMLLDLKLPRNDWDYVIVIPIFRWAHILTCTVCYRKHASDRQHSAQARLLSQPCFKTFQIAAWNVTWKANCSLAMNDSQNLD
mgnify:CR=1 FL=1